MKTEKMTKKQLVAETYRLLDELDYSVVRHAKVEVSLYRGCEKIGYSKYVYPDNDGRIFCVAILFDRGLMRLTDNQLNSGNINRIYQELLKEKENEGE